MDSTNNSDYANPFLFGRNSTMSKNEYESPICTNE